MAKMENRRTNFFKVQLPQTIQKEKYSISMKNLKLEVSSLLWCFHRFQNIENIYRSVLQYYHI